MLVLSSPSGAGKTTIARRLCERKPGIAMSISHTTRPRRNGEKDGKDYHFVDRDDFHPHARPGRVPGMGRGVRQFLRHHAQARRAGARGGPRRAVRRRLAGRSRACATGQATTSSPCLFCRLRPPTSSSASMSAPRTPPEIVRRRMLGASNEIQHWDEYDYVVVNHDIEQLGRGGARDPRRGTAAPLAADRPQGVRARNCRPSFSGVPLRARWRCGKSRQPPALRRVL